jgi:Rieske Fe-S protein
VPGFLYSEREADLEALHEEYEAARNAGVPVTMTREVPLPFRAAAAVRFERQAQLHPCRYLAALANAVKAAGSYVFEGSPVRSIQDGRPCLVTTDTGTVTADAVVMATDSPLTRFFVQTKIASYRSYVIAFVPRRPIAPGLFWDTDDPYHYVRAAEVAGVQYVIVGGEDHKTGHEADALGCFARLRAWARERFEFDEVAHRWSAQVIEPMDGLPFIGRSARGSNVWLSTGYSGTGMTFGTLGAMLIADGIHGRHNAWAGLYDAHRVHASGAKEYLVENADVAAYLVGDRLRGAEGTRLADVAPGEAKLLRLDGKKVAVYRDDAGAVHALSPVCPHLGCLVHFNNAERTWDCPCHGSRFSVRGEVLHGPAQRALSQASGPSIPPPIDTTPQEEKRNERD